MPSRRARRRRSSHNRKLGTQLTAGRQTAARALSKDITARMQTLGMAGGRFLIDVTQPTGEPAAHGFDAVEFRVTANPGNRCGRWPRSHRAASWRACRSPCRSRVRPRTRGAWCSTKWIPALVARVAEIVGRELKGSWISGQAICVTHAAAGCEPGTSSSARRETHGRQDHAHDDLRTHHDERAEELARMLGGLEVTGKAREHAREMLTWRVVPDQKARSGKRKA